MIIRRFNKTRDQVEALLEREKTSDSFDIHELFRRAEIDVKQPSDLRAAGWDGEFTLSRDEIWDGKITLKHPGRFMRVVLKRRVGDV